MTLAMLEPMPTEIALPTVTTVTHEIDVTKDLLRQGGASYRQQTMPDEKPLPNFATWRRIAAIARNTFREAVRDRVLYNLVLFVLLLTGCAIFVGQLSAANEAKIIVDLGLSASLVLGAFIAIFVGTGLVYKEIERRTVYAIFSKPVGRGEFLAGKFLGLCVTLFVNASVMACGISVALLYAAGGWTPLAANVFPAMLLIYFELVIVCAIALLFSTFSSPALSALLTFALFVAGHFSRDLQLMAESLGTHGAQVFFNFLYYVLPNFSNHAFITPAAHGLRPAADLMLSVALYTVLYAGAVLTAATLIFRHRNFK